MVKKITVMQQRSTVDWDVVWQTSKC